MIYLYANYNVIMSLLLKTYGSKNKILSVLNYLSFCTYYEKYMCYTHDRLLRFSHEITSFLTSEIRIICIINY